MSNVGKVFNLSGGGGSGSPKMESLTIATPPNKTVYKSGETFEPPAWSLWQTTAKV